MQFEYNNKKYSFPASLADITLGQRVDFFGKYGKDLEQKLLGIDAIADEFEKEGEMAVLNIDLAVKEFSHYTGIPLADVQNKIDLNSLMEIYAVDMELLREQERNIAWQPEYEWNGETWTISPPNIGPSDNMILNEFLHGKEIVRQMAKLGRGKWDTLPYLCAIYLRKKGESFAEHLVAEDSERIRLMELLPLDIALGVAFFLSSTLAIYKSTSAFSDVQQERESIQRSTSITGDG